MDGYSVRVWSQYCHCSSSVVTQQCYHQLLTVATTYTVDIVTYVHHLSNHENSGFYYHMNNCVKYIHVAAYKHH